MKKCKNHIKLKISRTVVFSISIDNVRQQSEGSAEPAHWQAPYQNRENPYI